MKLQDPSCCVEFFRSSLLADFCLLRLNKTSKKTLTTELRAIVNNYSIKNLLTNILTAFLCFT